VSETVEYAHSRGELLGSAIYNSRSAKSWRGGMRASSFHSMKNSSACVSMRHSCFAADHDARRWHGGSSVGVGPVTRLIVDRYDDVLVLQTLTAAMSRREESIANCCSRKTTAAPSSRATMRPCGNSRACVRAKTSCAANTRHPRAWTIAGHSYALDFWSGQKTASISTRRIIRRVAAHARDRRVLDCFTNQGGFALSAMKAGAKSCRRVDQSTEALKLAEATRRGEAQRRVDAGQCLRPAAPLRTKRERFDLVVLDPPSLHQEQGNKEGALRAITSSPARAKATPPRAASSRRSRARTRHRAGLGRTAAEGAAGNRNDLAAAPAARASSDHPILVNVPKPSIYAAIFWKKSMSRRRNLFAAVILG